jgi:putative phosphoribosyl transferase
VFRDRTEAGRALATKLMAYQEMRPIVLALPRGGVPVGLEITKALGAPFDLLFVRKIGVPWQPELAAAAVADVGGPELVRNEQVIRLANLSETYLAEEVQRESTENARRRQLYCANRSMPNLADRTVIIVDDGIATGATMLAAIHAVRRTKPARIVVAVPVAPPDTLSAVAKEADAVCCLESPTEFMSISQFYLSFPQLTDADVIELMRRAAALNQGAEKRAGPS